MERYTVKSCVRGYHVYKDIWEASIGEELICVRETSNPKDPFAVAVVKNEMIVGHIPKKISSVCSLFLKRKGVLKVRTTGGRQYSKDLPQGGIEIPCVLIFEGDSKDLSKVEKLISPILDSPSESKKKLDCNSDVPPESKKKKVDSATENEKENCSDRVAADDEEWVRCGSIILSKHEKEIISSGQRLTDKHINFAHSLLKQQFPSLEGLQSTLYQNRAHKFSSSRSALQIIHSRGNHWIVATTLQCDPGDIHVFDSVYESLDVETLQVIRGLFGNHFKMKVVGGPKQQGANDCGVFSIATSVCLAFGGDPTQMPICQASMRQALLDSFQLKDLSQINY